MAEDEPDITLDMVVQKYRDLRDAVQRIEDKAKLDVLVYKDAMTQIENFLSEVMHTMKLNSLPTGCGTAYKTTVTNVKIIDRQKLIDYAFENHVDLLQVSCNKTALKEYEEEKNKKGEVIKPGKPYPPGIEVTKISKVNIRGT